MQALLVESAMSAMNQQRLAGDSSATHPTGTAADNKELSHSSEVAQLRSEYDAKLAAAVEKATKVASPSGHQPPTITTTWQPGVGLLLHGRVLR